MSVQRINIFSLTKGIFLSLLVHNASLQDAPNSLIVPTSGFVSVTAYVCTGSLQGLQIPQASCTWPLCPRNTLLQSVQKSDAARGALSAILRGGCFSSGTRWVILDVRHFDPGTGSVADFH